MNARRALYDHTCRAHERRAAAAITNLREAADKAAVRLASPDGSFDRQRLASAAGDAVRAAMALFEAASALGALIQVSGAIPAPAEVAVKHGEDSRDE